MLLAAGTRLGPPRTPLALEHLGGVDGRDHLARGVTIPSSPEQVEAAAGIAVVNVCRALRRGERQAAPPVFMAQGQRSSHTDRTDLRGPRHRVGCGNASNAYWAHSGAGLKIIMRARPVRRSTPRSGARADTDR